ncbi:hypothetical protein PVAND_003098 [Polypedilum vanderplanki]|uniref:Peptidase S1 domain-containing protein n=1 Tax=Polypedilum vanderplanki TaxID=319348 RepID=A0A9J6BT19_POLVA|nr:hypothetical protein PVAND_003098 [Polypedilum vanderplanki]
MTDFAAALKKNLNYMVIVLISIIILIVGAVAFFILREPVNFSQPKADAPLELKKSKFEFKKCKKNNVSFENRIFGGEVVMDQQRYPFIVKFIATNSNSSIIFCGGSLISDDLILSAQHCFQDFNSTNGNSYKISIMLGGNVERNYSDGIIIDSSKFKLIKHPGYNHENMLNDIVLIKLHHKIQFSDIIDIVCLPLYDDVIPNDLKLIGFINGTTDKEIFIAEGKIPLVDNKKCFEKYDSFRKERFKLKNKIITKETRPISEFQFCAGDENVDSTLRDSGMPAIHFNEYNNAMTIYGIVSFGTLNNTLPGVYTKISSYLDWILINSE